MKKDIQEQGVLINDNSNKEQGPVTCLGMTFPNDAERRTYFTEELRKKLPELKKLEGFPLGEDEDILALSDPPYYTACPNPWIADFVAQWESEKPAKPEGYEYHREPFATDVSEGKNDPIYNAHSYHTKVPYKAIMRYILHYTEPGDIVFDGFCGTGMTGVATQMCGDRDAVLSLGYQVKEDGTILREEVAEDESTIWMPFSKLGPRRAILNDLSPAATFIAYNYNKSIDVNELKTLAGKVIRDLKKHMGWMWETRHLDGSQTGIINYVVWSDIYTCPQCTKEFIYYNSAFEKKEDYIEFHAEFKCPHCSCLISKSPSKDSIAQKPERVFSPYFDPITNKVERKTKQVPILINYSIGTKRFEKELDEEDLGKALNSMQKEDDYSYLPNAAILQGDKSGDPFGAGIYYVHQFYTNRILAVISEFRKMCVGNLQLEFLLGSILPKLTIMNRYMPQHGGRALVGPMANTLYVPPVSVENNVIDQLEFQIKKILKALNEHSGSVIATQAAQEVEIADSSVDYIFLDPPFGSNIMYSELNYIRESWLKIFTNNKEEAVESKAQNKGVDEYRQLMAACFNRAYRYLKPGRWMTVEFSNTKASIWNSIQSALADAGFIIATVASLDKSRGGLHAMIGPTAVKQDLVISAYKPDKGFEERFNKSDDLESGVWGFVNAHLEYLPVVKVEGKSLAKITERDPRILFDQLVAFYVRRGLQVPMSSQEFQIGLAQRFINNDDMYFLPQQAAEYERKKRRLGQLVQSSLFVSDESSAIEWLRQHLLKKPQTRQDLHPNYMKEIQHIAKYELLPELDVLLEQNFLQYDGTGPVPSQIHTYLSTNYKDMRELDKENPALQSKAKNRWYVPDPNKQSDLDKLREKSLLKEFAAYVEEISRSKKKLKQFRLEAIRAGFKKAWGEKDFKTIVDIGSKLPEAVLQEDDKLLMYYDNAQIRMGV